MIDPNTLIQMIKGGQNPQQLMMQAMQSMGNTPMGNNLLQMMQNGDTQGIEQIARNLLASKGLDYDKEFSAFRQKFGL